MKKALVVGMAVVACLGMAGCAEASTPPPPPPTEADIDAAMVEHAEVLKEQYNSAYPEVWENVEFERFIEIGEQEALVGECTREFGVTTVTFDSNGNMSWSDDSGTGYVSMVVNACTAIYPDEAYRSWVRSDAQLDYLYNYTATFLEPCLAAAGFRAEPMLSREAFVAESRRDLYSWSPYNSITPENVVWGDYTSDPDLYESNLETLMVRCPMLPEGIRQWGM
jgi:hypothetical protein